MKYKMECQCDECKFERDVVRAVADIVEFIQTSDACEECKFDAAMYIFQLGVEASELGYAYSDDFDDDDEEDEE